MPHPTIAVIGAGFSGTLLSLALQGFAPAGTRIRLIEGAGRFASGPAYGTTNPNHLLNASAGRMSAFPDRPSDFLDWLRAQPPARLGTIVPDATSFVSRGLYGAYLQHLLTRGLGTPHACRIELVDDQVTNIEESADRVTLRMTSGAMVSADMAVLAVGLPRAAALLPEIAVLEAAGLWRRDPWAPGLLEGLGPGATVLLIGSGLTMVDTVIGLLDTGHTGPIHAVSRHGMLPQRHVLPLPVPAILPPLPIGLLPLFRRIRREAERATAAGSDWRAIVDALRPLVPKLWRGWTDREKRQFLRHARVWWDVHRHRIAPQIADRIAAAQASGQLRLQAGHLVDLAQDDGQARVTLRNRVTGDLHTLIATRVIDCIGPGCDIARNTTPLLRRMFKAGLARPDALSLGLDVADDGALINGAGVASDRLFAVGALTRGGAWEITAVPELGRQCHRLARDLGRRLVRIAPGRDRSGDGVAPWGVLARERSLPMPRRYE